MCSVKVAKFWHKSKNLFLPPPICPIWLKLKLWVKICKMIKISAPFLFMLKKSFGQKFGSAIFSKWKKISKKGAPDFDF